MQPGWGSLLWFLAIIAAIPVVLWLLKRTPMVGGAGMRPGLPKPLSVTGLGGQHKLVTVEVGQGEDRLWLVLGVSPQGIRTLHTMVPQAEATDTPQAPPAATFQQLLNRLRGPGSGGGHAP